MLVQSGMFDSKFSNMYNSNETHELFTSIYLQIISLEERRII